MRASLVFSCLSTALILIGQSTAASSEESKGKSCRMEQQCHWENFKKVCVWVKVCR